MYKIVKSEQFLLGFKKSFTVLDFPWLSFQVIAAYILSTYDGMLFSIYSSFCFRFIEGSEIIIIKIHRFQK